MTNLQLADKWVRIAICAIAFMAVASAFSPWYSYHLRNKSLTRAEQRENIESLHLAEKAVFYNPLSIDALFVLAGAEQKLGRISETRATLMKAVELQPQNYITWEQLAIYERDRWGDPQSAAAHFEKAIELNPHDRQLQIRAGKSGRQ